MIYHDVAQSIEKVVISINDSGETIISVHPLTQVCRQLRAEARPILSSVGRTVATRYIVQMTGFQLEKLSQLADDIQEAKTRAPPQQATRKLRRSRYAPDSPAAEPKPRLHLTIFLCNQTESSAQATITQWLRHLSAKTDSPTKSPLRYADFFDRSVLAFRFHFHTKEMTPAQKRQTVTH